MSRAALALALLLGGCGPSSEDIANNLTSDNPVTREDTAKIAHNFDSEAVRQALMVALEDDAKAVRYTALDSLIQVEAVEAVPAIMALLEREQDRDVERLAVDALGRLKDRQAVPTLIAYIERCQQDPARGVPLNAIWALGFIGDRQAMPLLAQLRESDDPFISWNATQALKTLQY